MTPKQRAFADEYLKNGCNATRAYMAVYPRVKNANSAHTLAGRLLRNVAVKTYLHQQLNELHDETIADTREIMQFLTSVMRDEKNEELLTPSGEVRKVSSRITDRINAAAKLAKILGIDNRIEAERLKMEQERHQLTMQQMAKDEQDGRIFLDALDAARPDVWTMADTPEHMNDSENPEPEDD